MTAQLCNGTGKPYFSKVFQMPLRSAPRSHVRVLLTCSTEHVPRVRGLSLTQEQVRNSSSWQENVRSTGVGFQQTWEAFGRPWRSHCWLVRKDYGEVALLRCSERQSGPLLLFGQHSRRGSERKAERIQPMEHSALSPQNYKKWNADCILGIFALTFRVGFHTRELSCLHWRHLQGTFTLSVWSF